ncbi:helix-turn-helix domain-containing protein [Saccharomonospora halophila]|uniref:helix-turn-helix domain-containing protein n=1 Tax=Saccharomonospora halophila TaxID=129922 RepID=UPI0009FF17C4|nr:XRE family transcriptional regulator [Saccharomonospora halophila]
MFTPSRLVLARKRRGFTLTRLADEVGLTAQSLSNAENGRQVPSMETLTALSEVLNFPATFFEQPDATEISLEQVSFRARTKTSARTRDAALSAASLAVELHKWFDARFELPRIDIPTLNGRMDPELAATYVRARWGLKPGAGISNIVHLLEAHGVAVYSLPPEHSDVDAFSFWLDGKPFVLLNTLKSAERGRFDGAHELGHLVLHEQVLGGQKTRTEEKEADAFASAFLMPTESVRRNFTCSPSVEEVIHSKKKWKVSALALTYRLRELGVISDWGYRRAVIDLGRMGYRASEPNGIIRETSLVLKKVLSSLRSSGIPYGQIYQDLHISPSELSGLIFNLAIVPIEDGSGYPGENQHFAAPERSLRLVQ